MSNNELKQNFDKIITLSCQLENQIDEIATYACRKGSPRSVQLLMAEYDKVRRIVRRVDQIVNGQLGSY